MKKLKSLRVLPWSLSLQVTELGLGPDAQTVLFPTPAPLPTCPVSFCSSKEDVAAGWAGRAQPGVKKDVCFLGGVERRGDRQGPWLSEDQSPPTAGGLWEKVQETKD